MDWGWDSAQKCDLLCVFVCGVYIHPWMDGCLLRFSMGSGMSEDQVRKWTREGGEAGLVEFPVVRFSAHC